MVADALVVTRVERPVVQFQCAAVPRRGLERVPAVVAAHARIEGEAAVLLGMRVHRVDHVAPHLDVGAVAGQVQRVGPAVGHAVGKRAVVAEVGPLAGVRPAEHPSPPAAAVGAAEGSVQADVGRHDVVVGARALQPPVGVLQQPVPVLRLAVEHVGVQRPDVERQVHRTVADHVRVVLFVVDDVVVVIPVAAAGVEPARDLEGVAAPVGGGRRAQQRAAAAGHGAADDAVLGVVVGLRRLVRVARQVEAGEALHALAVDGVPRLAQPLLEQAVVPLAVVQRVEAGRVLLVVHAVAAQLGDGGLRLRVLPDVAFDAVPEQVVHVARPAHRVEIGKGGDVLRRVVGAVQRAPARHALQVALLVEVAVVEDPARLGDGVDQVPLQQRPARRRHRFADGDHRTPIHRRASGAQSAPVR